MEERKGVTKRGGLPIKEKMEKIVERMPGLGGHQLIQKGRGLA